MNLADKGEKATVGVNDHWAGNLDLFDSFAGGALAVSIILLVFAVAIWATVAMFKPQFKTEMFTKILGSVGAAALVGIVASSVVWVSEETPGVDVAVPKTSDVKIEKRTPKSFIEKANENQEKTDKNGHKGADQAGDTPSTQKAPEGKGLQEQLDNGGDVTQCEEPEWHKGSGLPWDEEDCKMSKVVPSEEPESGADQLPGAASRDDSADQAKESTQGSNEPSEGAPTLQQPGQDDSYRDGFDTGTDSGSDTSGSNEPAGGADELPGSGS